VGTSTEDTRLATPPSGTDNQRGALEPWFRDARLLKDKAIGSTWDARRADTGERVAVRVGAELEGGLGLSLRELAPLIWDALAAWDPIAHETEVLARVAGPGVPPLRTPADAPPRVLACSWVEDAVPLETLAPLDPEVAFAVGVAVCDVLDRAHRAGVVHRDLTPANILVRPDQPREVRVVDWELASCDGRRSFGPVGTRGFIAPELLALRTGAQPPDAARPAVDVYGLGASLYYAIHGEVPYGADEMEIVNGAPLSRGRLDERQHAALAALLARSPESRPRTAAAARAVLEGRADADADADADARGTAAPEPRAPSLNAALDAIDAGELHRGARILDRVGLGDQGRAALGYAYLAWRLGREAIAATLLLTAADDGGLRSALASACSGEAAAPDPQAAPRSHRVLAAAALERGAWVEAFAHLDLDAPDAGTVALVKARVDALTRGPLDADARSELTVWASCLAGALPEDLADTANALAARAYPGPAEATNYLPHHAVVIAAASASPGAAGAVAGRLVAARAYPIHERIGLSVVGFSEVDEAVGASLVELGLRGRAVALVETVEADRWRVRAALLLACGELDACRRCLERVPDGGRGRPAFFRLHVAQLLHANRPHVAATVYRRACETLAADDAAPLHTLGAYALVRSNDAASARALRPHLERDGGVLARDLLARLGPGEQG